MLIAVKCCVFSTIFYSCVIAGKSKTTSKETTSNSEEDLFSVDNYGKTWMYFPDGDGIPRRISLEIPPSYRVFPESLYAKELEYRLYTKYNKQKYVLLNKLALPINVSDPEIIDNLQKAPVKLVTHGWMSSADKNSVTDIKNAYLESDDVNVIGVNWGNIANSYIYPTVALQTFSVGIAVGKFIDALSDRYSIPADQIHLIGHSLGAHVMGKAGSTTKLNVSEITGLDPARPLFEFPSSSNDFKLDSSDAQFVTIIHTSSGIFGVKGTIGDADFFPNGGIAPQPGCLSLLPILDSCSHSRAYELFADSIRHPKSLPAYPCSDWKSFKYNECNMSKSYLGKYVNRSAFGVFYLKTNYKSPYGII